MSHFCVVFQRGPRGSRGTHPSSSYIIIIRLQQGKYNWYELSHGRINIAPTDKDSFLSSPLVAIYQSALSRSFRTGKTSGDFAGGFLYCALSAGVCG